MADDFKGGGFVTIQPGSSNIQIGMKFPPASASTTNDGAIPYGSTVKSVTIEAHYGETGSSSTDLLISNTATLSSNTAYVLLTYSTALSTGIHHLTANVRYSLSGSASTALDEYDFHRVLVRSI